MNFLPCKTPITPWQDLYFCLTDLICRQRLTRSEINILIQYIIEIVHLYAKYQQANCRMTVDLQEMCDVFANTQPLCSRLSNVEE